MKIDIYDNVLEEHNAILVDNEVNLREFINYWNLLI